MDKLKRDVKNLSTGYGISIKEIAEMAGLSPWTLYSWRNGQKLGEESLERVREVVKRLKRITALEKFKASELTEENFRKSGKYKR